MSENLSCLSASCMLCIIAYLIVESLTDAKMFQTDTFEA